MQQQWEYLQLRRKRSVTPRFFGASYKVGAWDKTVSLNELGRQGWELITIVPYAGETAVVDLCGITTDEIWLFKRQVEDQQTPCTSAVRANEMIIHSSD